MKALVLISAWKPTSLYPLNCVFLCFTFAPVFSPPIFFLLLNSCYWETYFDISIPFLKIFCGPLLLVELGEKRFLFCISRSSETPILSSISKSSFPFTLYSLFSYPATVSLKVCKAFKIIGCTSEWSRKVLIKTLIKIIHETFFEGMSYGD